MMTPSISRVFVVVVVSPVSRIGFPPLFEGRAELGRPDRNESGCAKELLLEGARRRGPTQLG